LREQQLSYPFNLVQVAAKFGLLRSNAFICKLEKSISTIDVHLIKHMMKFSSHTHALLWCSRINEALAAFHLPIKRLFNFFADSDCMISYGMVWRILKQLDLRGINPINERDSVLKHKNKIEAMLTKVANYVQKRNDPFGLKENEGGLLDTIKEEKKD